MLVPLLGPTAFDVIVRRLRVVSRVGVVVLLLLVNNRRLTTLRPFWVSWLVKCIRLGQCLVSRVKFVPVSLKVFLIYVA